LSGRKHVAIGSPISFVGVKNASKFLKVTINDIITSSVSNAIATYFKNNGDQSSEINIIIPVNIRWGMYKTFESVKMENKFAPATLTIPLITDPVEALSRISKITKNLRSGFPTTYCMYVLSIVTAVIFP
jgi:NRPS condensation-like uncharacterized protein